MHFLKKSKEGCPHLILAPMEGVGDRCFRRAMAAVGGMDEVVKDFLRVPSNAHVQSLARVYDPQELAPLSLVVQLMGSDETLMRAMAKEVERLGAPRIDLNCGCPSNTVTGRGAGSKLLKDPQQLYCLVKALAEAVSVPVTVKMRAGYEDSSLFQDNLLAAQEGGAYYVTVHPRTKVEGYATSARWELIAKAKSLLRIPVVGNGDIFSVKDALAMLQQTHCDGLMIGRGALINPFLFKQIKAHFAKTSYTPTWPEMKAYVDCYVSSIAPTLSERQKINKLKQWLGFLFQANPLLLERRALVLSSKHKETQAFLEWALPHLKVGYDDSSR